ncbi:Gar1/Naf1 family protein [Methanococcus voltae]|uniref:H/ACA RNA-protein complex component Gar1 n=1 Tax=Methanococcus voltae (strain ATCC BAA-1334 / A3) TaxID=456320 RepID=D7DV85_METV3|nr:Gar1/Naf1 family protein [Methanococcus voltae]MCS3901912.1 RNA-binding protein [Methanococcus voltae]
MEKIELLHETPKGKLIGLGKNQIPIGSMVGITENKKFLRIGIIYDIFGPITRPYVKIIPDDSAKAEIALKNKYLIIKPKNNSKKSYRNKKARKN